MTKENSIRLLEHYKTIGRTDAYEDMKQHMIKGTKFSKEETDALFSEKAEVKKEIKKEVKEKK